MFQIARRHARTGRRHATSGAPVAGAPVLGVACASAMGTPATLPLDEQNLPGAESAAHHASTFEAPISRPS